MSWRNECSSLSSAGSCGSKTYMLVKPCNSTSPASLSKAAKPSIPKSNSFSENGYVNGKSAWSSCSLVKSTSSSSSSCPTIKPSSMPSNLSSFEKKVGFGASSCEYSVPTMTHLEHEWYDRALRFCWAFPYQHQPQGAHAKDVKQTLVCFVASAPRSRFPNHFGWTVLHTTTLSLQESVDSTRAIGGHLVVLIPRFWCSVPNFSTSCTRQAPCILNCGCLEHGQAVYSNNSGLQAPSKHYPGQVLALIFCCVNPSVQHKRVVPCRLFSKPAVQTNQVSLQLQLLNPPKEHPETETFILCCLEMSFLQPLL